MRQLTELIVMGSWCSVKEAIPSAENPMIPLQWVDQVGRFRRKRCVFEITLWLYVQNRSSDRRTSVVMDNLSLTMNVWGSGCLWGSWCIVYCGQGWGGNVWGNHVDLPCLIWGPCLLEWIDLGRWSLEYWNAGFRARMGYGNAQFPVNRAI